MNMTLKVIIFNHYNIDKELTYKFEKEINELKSIDR
jgi:hypothetical protein